MVPPTLLALLLPIFANFAAAAMITIRVDGDSDLAGSLVVEVRTTLDVVHATVPPGASETTSLADDSYVLWSAWSDIGTIEPETTPVPLNVTVIVSLGAALRLRRQGQGPTRSRC